MGDLITESVDGKLSFVPVQEFNRVLTNQNLSLLEKTDIFAKLCRINILYMIAKAGSGHIGSSFSSIEIMAYIYLNEIYGKEDQNNVFFSSKGHDAPALYSVLLALGKLDFDLIHTLRKFGGLPGHPDVGLKNIITNTGSLGMGISKAKGMLAANTKLGIPGRIHVLTGDGELQEGQLWESLVSAANRKLDDLVVIVDHNKLQSDTLVSKVSDLGNLEAKFESFGWKVFRCDGNNIKDFSETLEKTKLKIGKPKVIIADTIKGKGVSFMENSAFDSDVEDYKYHSGAPSAEAYYKALEELFVEANVKFKSIGEPLFQLNVLERPKLGVLENIEKLIPAYSDVFLTLAKKHNHIFALDADLVLDTGLIPFKKEIPERFIECGIAEQDMVSQAGGLALKGQLPFVHSFSCFLTQRANEQIYNNATEKTKIIYVGSLAGVLPGGPGHSHQAVRDISIMASIPNLLVIEPSSVGELEQLLPWITLKCEESVYFRLVSIPYTKEKDYKQYNDIKIGVGRVARKGKKVTIVTHGPVILSQVLEAAEILSQKHGLDLHVISTPWLNRIDSDWFKNELESMEKILFLENHTTAGGLSSIALNEIALNWENKPKLKRIGVDGIPVFGTNVEVLEYYKLNAVGIVQTILEF